MICIRSSSEINFMKTPAGATEGGRSARNKKKGLFGSVETECSLFCEGARFFSIPKHADASLDWQFPSQGGIHRPVGARLGGYKPMMLRSKCSGRGRIL